LGIILTLNYSNLREAAKDSIEIFLTIGVLL
jgi:hypothetical protein